MIDESKMKIIRELLEAVNEFNGSKSSRYMASFDLFNCDEIMIQYIYHSDTMSCFLNWDLKTNEMSIGALTKCAARIKSDMDRLKAGVNMAKIVCSLPTDGTRVEVKKYVERY